MKQFWFKVLSLLLVFFTCGSACFSQPKSEETDRALHVLNRITYGPRPGDVEAVAKMGVDRFIDQQLHPESIAVPDSLKELIASKPALTLTPARMFLEYGRPALKLASGQKDGPPDDKDAKKEAQQLMRDTYKKIYQDQFEVRLNRALDSPRQLEELLTEFWFNHFNVSFDKGLDHLWVGSFEEVAIRPYAMGKFRDLLGATAHHAAMLFYLDNWQNSATKKMAADPNGRFKGLNENYARELMELHTLGVDGGYTQADVIALARILTGLGLQSRKDPAANGGLDNKFGDSFDMRRHDMSDKEFLGRKIDGSGEAEIEESLDILASHPATAHHISYQLAQFFLNDNPPVALVDKMSKTFLATGGDIRAVIGQLLHSDEFWKKDNRACKFKSPYRYIVSAMRASNTDATNIMPVVQFLRQQGMPAYQCLTPDGYKNTEAAWLNSDALLNRINFATALGTGKLRDLKPDISGYQEVEQLLGASASAATLAAVQKAPDQLKVSLVLGSPEFMKY
jgi:uncharacterized protein (DUF1800 family)